MVLKTLPNAEDVNYWQSGQSSPDTWIAKTRKQLEAVNGRILGEAYGRDGDGNAAFMLEFEIDGDQFKAIWPVLPSRTGKERAAKIQAATMLYHDVKARCVSALVLGTRSAFFNYLMLPNGRTAAEASAPELMAGVPLLLHGNRAGLPSGVIDGVVE